MLGSEGSYSFGGGDVAIEKGLAIRVDGSLVGLMGGPGKWPALISKEGSTRDLRRRKNQNAKRAMIPKPATPPTTPPAIAPASLEPPESDCGEGVGDSSGGGVLDPVGLGVPVDSGPLARSFARFGSNVSEGVTSIYAQLGTAVPKGMSPGKSVCTVEQLALYNDHLRYERLWQAAQALSSE